MPGWARDLEEQCMNSHELAYEEYELEMEDKIGFVEMLITEQYTMQ